MSFWIIEAAYLVASALFVMSLHWMNDPKTARRGVFAGVAAMALAIVGTLLQPRHRQLGLDRGGGGRRAS